MNGYLPIYVLFRVIYTTYNGTSNNKNCEKECPNNTTINSVDDEYQRNKDKTNEEIKMVTWAELKELRDKRNAMNQEENIKRSSDNTVINKENKLLPMKNFIAKKQINEDKMETTSKPRKCYNIKQSVRFIALDSESTWSENDKPPTTITTIVTDQVSKEDKIYYQKIHKYNIFLRKTFNLVNLFAKLYSDFCLNELEIIKNDNIDRKVYHANLKDKDYLYLFYSLLIKTEKRMEHCLNYFNYFSNKITSSSPDLFNLMAQYGYFECLLKKIFDEYASEMKEMQFEKINEKCKDFCLQFQERSEEFYNIFYSEGN